MPPATSITRASSSTTPFDPSASDRIPAPSLLHYEPAVINSSITIGYSTRRLFGRREEDDDEDGEDDDSGDADEDEESEPPTWWRGGGGSIASVESSGTISSTASSSLALPSTTKLHRATSGDSGASSTTAVASSPPSTTGATAVSATFATSTSVTDQSEHLWRQYTRWTKFLSKACEKAEEMKRKERKRVKKEKKQERRHRHLENEKHQITKSTPPSLSPFLLYSLHHTRSTTRLLSNGIPSSYRGFVWSQLLGAQDMSWREEMMKKMFVFRDDFTTNNKNNHNNHNSNHKPSLSSLTPHHAYTRILREFTPASSSLSGNILLQQIYKDLPRTFTRGGSLLWRDGVQDLDMRRDGDGNDGNATVTDNPQQPQSQPQPPSSGLGQSSLYSVLSAYSFFDPQLGYCQGMGYITGTLLQYCNEEDTFWCLVALLHKEEYGQLRTMFLESMTGLRKMFFLFEKCLEITLPRVSQRFMDLGIHLSMFASTWFLTFFAGSFTMRRRQGQGQQANETNSNSNGNSTTPQAAASSSTTSTTTSLGLTNDDTEITSRIWDMFLGARFFFFPSAAGGEKRQEKDSAPTTATPQHGMYMLIRVGLAILKIAEKTLLPLSFEHSLSRLKHLQSTVTPEALIQAILSIELDLKLLGEWEAEWKKREEEEDEERRERELLEEREIQAGMKVALASIPTSTTLIVPTPIVSSPLHPHTSAVPEVHDEIAEEDLEEEEEEEEDEEDADEVAEIDDDDDSDTQDPETQIRYEPSTSRIHT